MPQLANDRFLADLQYSFYGGGVDQTLAFYQAAATAGVNATHLLAPALSRRAAPGYHWVPGGRGDQVSIAYGVNNLVAFPFVLQRPEPVDRIFAECSTALASSVLRVGLYLPHATTGLPDALSTDFGGTFDGSTTGVKSLTISYTVPAGRSWLAFVQQGAAATWRGTNLTFDLTQFATSTAVDVGRCVIHTGAVAAALPATFVPNAAAVGDANALKVFFRSV